MFEIDIDISASKLEQFLQEKFWIDPSSESIERIEKAGEGNMNVVLRVHSNLRSFILKQSRPFVNKYPQVAAPIGRIDVEFQFLKSMRDKELLKSLPRIYYYDKQHHLLMMEDLGHGEDMIAMYNERSIADDEVDYLIDLLHRIHLTPADKSYPENAGLRRLNHQHVFHLPFAEDNGFDLDSIQQGLQSASEDFKKDEHILKVAKDLGEKYLGEGQVLLHGDYYPGSWLRSHNKIYIIDAEFSFRGFVEYDLGVMAAHLFMTDQDPLWVDKVTGKYPGSIDEGIMRKIAGVEVVRRLIGLAQLPMERSLGEKIEMLEWARRMMVS